MSGQDLHFHYVCTSQEASELVKRHNRFWVSNCGCRENRGKCNRSRMDVCLMFKGDISGSGGSGKKEIPLSTVGENPPGSEGETPGFSTFPERK